MSNDKKRILLVGGSGYLGSHLRHALVSYDVLFTSRSQKEQAIQIDLLDKASFQNLKEQKPFDYIVILASSMQGLGTTEFREEYLDIDAKGLPSFLQFISENNLSEKLVYISSMTVYGLKNEVPVVESAHLEPLSAYGLSKVLGEKIVKFYSLNNVVKSMILRIPGIYGGNRTSGFIYNTIQKCRKNEPVNINTATLGYWETIHVDDLCQWLVALLERYTWQSKVETFNISYGVKTDIVECAAIIKETLGSSSEITAEGRDGYCDFYLDNAKVKQIIPVEDRYVGSLKKYIENF